MPRKCTICIHPNRVEIDRAMLGGIDSYRDISNRWGVSRQAVLRHRQHIAEAVETVAVALREEVASATLDQLIALQRQTLDVLEDVRQKMHELQEDENASRYVRLRAYDVVFRGLEQARKNLELIGRFRNELGPAAQVAVQNNLNLNVDLSSLSDDQLLRLASGEDVDAVLRK